MTFRSFLYWLARLIGDINAARRGPRAMERRLKRRLMGRITGRLLRRL